MADVMDKKEQFAAAFAQREAALAENAPDWVHHLRKEALAHLGEIGFPTRRHEEWRYTNLKPILEQDFASAESVAARVTAEEIEPHTYGSQFHTVVFVNGRFAPNLSALGDLPAGVRVTDLASVLRSDGERIEPYLARQGSYENLPFAAINTAFFEDGALVSIAKNAVVERPILVLYYSTSLEQAAVSYPRTLIVAGSQSQAKVIESYAGAAGHTYLTNAVTEISVGENANLEHVRLQRESLEGYHLSNTRIHLDRSSQFASHSISLGGLLVRNDIAASLDAEGIDAILNGLYLVSGNQHVDNQTLIRHAKPHCNSHELYKGILDENGSAVFRGKIYVAKDAQKTDSKQTNNALLLSEGAEISAMPQLEIYADDVKCTHGATTGQLDPDALFYLRTRGISLPEAKGLLTFAFASDIIDRIGVEAVREDLHNLLFARLPLQPYGKVLV